MSRTWTRAAVSLLALGGLLQASCGDKVPPTVPTGGTDAGASSAESDAGAPVVGVPDARAELEGEARAAYERGFTAWTKGDLDTARAGFDEATRKAPKSAAAHYSLGTVLERLGEPDAARAAFKRAFEAQDDFEYAMGSYALSLARTGGTTEAETFLKERLQKRPDSPRLTTYLADVKSMAGDTTEAQKLAQDVLRKHPDFRDAMIVVARDFYRRGRYETAKYALKAILDGSDDKSIPARAANNAEAMLLRALIARAQGDRKLAIASFEAAGKSRRDLFEAHIGLGQMRLEAGNAQDALEPLESAVKYGPRAGTAAALARLNIGDCYRLLGRSQDAKAALEKALALDSSLAAARYNLGLLYLFSPNVPGAGNAEEQVALAIKELETYKQMRGPKPRGQSDDVDDLIATAKRKQAELKVAASQPPVEDAGAPAPPPPPPPPASASAAPAPSGIVREAP